VLRNETSTTSLAILFFWFIIPSGKHELCSQTDTKSEHSILAEE